MLTKTSLTAVRTLVHLGLHPTSEPASLKRMAEQLGESPTYLAKVARLLVRAGILRAHRGVAGGVVLNRPPESITLLSIVEACQGTILGDFCQETSDLNHVCALHHAGSELHEAIIKVLSRWNLEHFVQRPTPSGKLLGRVPCWLQPKPAAPPTPARGGGNGHSRRRGAR